MIQSAVFISQVIKYNLKLDFNLFEFSCICQRFINLMAKITTKNNMWASLAHYGILLYLLVGIQKRLKFSRWLL